MCISSRVKCSHTIIALALIVGSAFADSSDFQKLLANPPAFHGKRLSLIGVASVGGAGLFLYPSEREARKAGAAVLIAPNQKRTDYGRFNNHWVKVTGIVDATRHGAFNSYPCEISPESLELLPQPPLKDTNIYGVFRNDTSSLVNVRVYRPDGYSDFGVPPGSTSNEGIEESSTAVVTAPSGKLIAKSNLIPSKARSQYFDSVHRSYYYRITNGKIELVPPREAKAWKIYRFN